MFIYVFLLIAAALSCALTPLVRYAARCIGAVDQPGGRKIHAIPTPRLGGVSVVVSGVLTVLIVWGLEYGTGGVVRGELGAWKPVCFGGAIVFLLGVWDDVRPIPAGVKFVLQGVAAGVAIWGGILVEHVSLCGDCHTPRNFIGAPKQSLYLAGAGKKIGPLGQEVLNITPDKETGIGDWKREDIVELLINGTKPDMDNVQGLMAEVIEHGYKSMTKEDALAIADYLKSIPPIKNKIK